MFNIIQGHADKSNKLKSTEDLHYNSVLFFGMKLKEYSPIKVLLFHS